MQTTTAHARPATAAAAHPRTGAGWMPVTGRVLTALAGAFLLFDGGARVAGFAPYVEGTVHAGYPETLAPAIGVTLLVSTVLYLLPRTAVLGAILLTGYLGGAVASHLRIGQPVFFPAVFGVVVWAALYLRDPRLRDSLPVRR